MRQSYFTEQSRNESYREILSDKKKLGESQWKVLEQVKQGAKTLQEIAELIGMKEHLVSARLNELRESHYVITDGEKKLNPLTKKHNSLWKINTLKFKQEVLF